MKISLNRDFFIKHVFIYTLVLNYIFDALNKIFGLYYPDLSRIGLLFRISFQVLIFILILIFLSRRRLNGLIIFSYYLICFLIANLTLKFDSSLNFSVLEQFIYFNKYFFLLMAFFLFEEFLNNKENLNKVKNIFLKIFYFNGWLALIGFVFDLRLFRIFTQHKTSLRFGYNGLINAINESSIFYLLAVVVIYHDWRYSAKKNYYFFLAIFFTLIVGTKAVYLGLFFLIIYHLITTINLKKLIIVFGSILTSSIILYMNIERLRSVFGFIVYKANNVGLFYTFMGGRNELFLERFKGNITFVNLIRYLTIGDNVALKEKAYSIIEMDIIDVLLFFGLFNGLLYLMLFKRYIIGVVNTKYYLFVVFLFFMISFFSGHFFTSIVNGLYILIVFNYLRKYEYK